jgi:hypothetical protein
MNRKVIVFLSVLLASSVWPAWHRAEQQTGATTADIASLSWLAGCWASENGEPGSGEHWMPPAGKTMLGMARTVKGGKTVAHEFMQIRPDENGRLGFFAQPSGQESAFFPLQNLTENEAIFENPDHDFPQKIIYRRQASRNLIVVISGENEGESRSVGFPMRRTGCGSLANNPEEEQ